MYIVYTCICILYMYMYIIYMYTDCVCNKYKTPIEIKHLR